ncbi:hypothetical protein [Actinomadura litoris]|uniref:Uncharacterized protein n=1 Tax=Actinomadura litoris TaxID=2678616 RepID=A0A7K1KTR1_9ACTN|nr:hypothetical protein [Actinomadura litoris]MUN35559.1 hypothetical protein [Actinomadura litoris]
MRRFTIFTATAGALVALLPLQAGPAAAAPATGTARACDPHLTGFSLPTPDLFTADEVTGTVQASCAPSEDIAVGLATGDRRVTVPPLAIVPAGRTTAAFPLKVREAPSDQFKTKVAARYGADLLAQPVTVSPGLKAFTLRPESDGVYVYGEISLWGLSPTGGTVVRLTSDSPLLNPPTTKTVRPNVLGEDFRFAAERVTSPQKVHVTATVGTRTMTAEVTLVPSA